MNWTALVSWVSLLSAQPEPVRLLLERAEDEVLRPDAPMTEDLRRASAFAASLGRPSVIDRQPSRMAAFEALIEGRADLLVTPTVGEGAPELGTLWSSPLRNTDVIVVGRKGQKKPATLGALGGLHIARTSDLGPVLAEHFEKAAVAMELKAHAEIEESSDLLGLIATGAMPHGVVLRDDLEAFKAYRDDVEVWFVVRAIPLVWVVRADQEAFLARLNEFLKQPLRANTGDLDSIRAAGVLRVAMLNNGTSYYLERDEPAGFHHDFAAHLAERLGVRLEVIVPSQPSAMDSLLARGKADLYVSAVRPEADVPNTVFSKPLMSASIVLVQPANETPVRSLEQLAGRTIVARKSSQYWPILEAAKAKVSKLKLQAADESLETETLIEQVAAKKIPLTVANEVLFRVERRRHDDIQSSWVFATDRPLAYGVPKGSKKLLAWLNATLSEPATTAVYKRLYEHYFAVLKVEPVAAAHETEVSAGAISKYDPLIQRLSQEFGFEWRLIAAQMFTESRFNPKARSHAGALGLMQVMPRTGHSMGYKRLDDPDEGARAGVHYMRDMRAKFKSMGEEERLRFAWASYNGGFAHVRDAQLLAKEQGLDPNRWHGNVAQTILMLQKKEHYAKAKYGYCRGKEVRDYVERIETKHAHYSKK